jgi:hypothetical protein
MKKIGRLILVLVAVLIALFLILQIVPIGKNHTNPAVVSEPNWDSPATRDLAKRACFDCHSNETTWPWYSYVAPVSWLVYNDVMEGRSIMNFSDWGASSRLAGDLVEEIQSGGMPPSFYLPMHPSAKLSSSEKQQLIDGLTNSLP